MNQEKLLKGHYKTIKGKQVLVITGVITRWALNDLPHFNCRCIIDKNNKDVE